MKHTPAPWNIASYMEDFDGESDTVIEHDGFPLATIRGTNDMSCIDEEETANIAEECRANANLIAAAPEMLEALEMANRLLQSKIGNLFNEWPESQVIESTIAKAKGNE